MCSRFTVSCGGYRSLYTSLTRTAREYTRQLPIRYVSRRQHVHRANLRLLKGVGRSQVYSVCHVQWTHTRFAEFFSRPYSPNEQSIESWGLGVCWSGSFRMREPFTLSSPLPLRPPYTKTTTATWSRSRRVIISPLSTGKPFSPRTPPPSSSAGHHPALDKVFDEKYFFNNGGGSSFIISLSPRLVTSLACNFKRKLKYRLTTATRQCASSIIGCTKHPCAGFLRTHTHTTRRTSLHIFVCENVWFFFLVFILFPPHPF